MLCFLQQSRRNHPCTNSKTTEQQGRACAEEEETSGSGHKKARELRQNTQLTKNLVVPKTVSSDSKSSLSNVLQLQFGYSGPFENIEYSLFFFFLNTKLKIIYTRTGRKVWENNLYSEFTSLCSASISLSILSPELYMCIYWLYEQFT